MTPTCGKEQLQAVGGTSDKGKNERSPFQRGVNVERVKNNQGIVIIVVQCVCNPYFVSVTVLNTLLILIHLIFITL